jgi:hypothetical protein
VHVKCFIYSFYCNKNINAEHFTNHFHTCCTQNLYIHAQMEAETLTDFLKVRTAENGSCLYMITKAM